MSSDLQPTRRGSSSRRRPEGPDPEPAVNGPRSRSRSETPSWLDRARSVGDPSADVVVARLVRDGRLAEVDALLASVVSDATPLPRTLPPQVRTFLEREGLPRWADRGRLMRAQQFAESCAVPIAATLFCSALPTAFTGAKGVSVLRATNRMHDDVDRRVNETGRFVFDVLMPGGFESGLALRSIQKVRLLHAAVRHRVLASQRAAGRHGGEVPINQEDLLGTLHCFSVLVLEGLERMGVAVTRQESEDFFHLWRVTGHTLGIHEPWLPSDVAAARSLGAAIRSRQGLASPEGRELARVLVDGIERHLPARGLGLVAPGLVRFFIGDDAARSLGLSPGSLDGDLARLLPSVTGMLRSARDSAVGDLLPRLGRAALEIWMSRKLGARAPLFESPLGAAEPRRRDARRGRTRAGE